MATALLDIEEVSAGQDQKEVTINDGFAAIEEAGNESLSVSLASGNVTLTTAQWTRYVLFSCTGHSVSRDLVVPLTSRLFVVSNVGTGVVTVKGSSGTTVAVAASTRALLHCTSAGVVLVANNASSGAVAVELGFAVSDETTTITTGTAKLTFRMPHAMTLTSVRASLTAASSSGVVTVDINEGGSTILSTKLTVDASEKTSTTAATPAVISDTALADDAEMTIDIDTAGTGATGLKVWLIGTR